MKAVKVFASYITPCHGKGLLQGCHGFLFLNYDRLSSQRFEAFEQADRKQCEELMNGDLL